MFRRGLLAEVGMRARVVLRASTGAMLGSTRFSPSRESLLWDEQLRFASYSTTKNFPDEAGPRQVTVGIQKDFDLAPTRIREVRISSLTGNVAPWQRDRFPEPSSLLTIYETPGRRKLWGDLDSSLMHEEEASLSVSVTGVSGCGKSHALALWALQQQEKGHLVVYVPTCDMVKRSWGNVFYRLLRHATMCMWKKRGLELKSTPTDAEMTQEWDRIIEDEYRLLVEDYSLPFRTVGRFVTGADFFPKYFALFVNELARKVVSSAGSKIGDPIKTIMIFDQDNRLFRHAHQEKLMEKGARRTATSAWIFTKEIQFDLNVFCASANNEGWERRGLEKTFIVNAEPVPQDCVSLIVPALADSTQLSLERAAQDHFWVRLKQLTGLYPLELRLFAAELAGGGGILSLEDALSSYEERRRDEVRNDIEEFIDAGALRQKTMYNVLTERTIRGKLTAKHDRRYVHEIEFLHEGKPTTMLKFISPIVADAARDAFKTLFSQKPQPARFDSEGLWYEYRIKILFMMQDVLRLNKPDARGLQEATAQLPGEILAGLRDGYITFIEPTHTSQRAYDFVLATRNHHGVCVIFAQVCRGARHKDSFRDFLSVNQTNWIDELLQRRKREPCYVGYLWVTQTSLVGENVTLSLADSETYWAGGGPSMPDFRPVTFQKRGDPAAVQRWRGVIKHASFVIGRRSKDVEQTLPEFWRRPWRQSGIDVDEMHITVPESELTLLLNLKPKRRTRERYYRRRQKKDRKLLNIGKMPPLSKNSSLMRDKRRTNLGGKRNSPKGKKSLS